MSKIITGTQPQVEQKFVTAMIHGGYSANALDAAIEGTKRSGGVPPEATLHREPAAEFDATKYTWEWWEITL